MKSLSQPMFQVSKSYLNPEIFKRLNVVYQGKDAPCEVPAKFITWKRTATGSPTARYAVDGAKWAVDVVFDRNTHKPRAIYAHGSHLASWLVR
jgi:hypothetical protein